MRFVRFQAQGLSPQYGWVQEERVGRLEGDLFSGYRRLSPEYHLDKVQLLAPVLPGKIIGAGRNYPEHAQERKAEVPKVPVVFFKPPSAVIGPGTPIVLPPQSQQVDFEGELAVVIGRSGRWIHTEDAAAHIFGYTIANDVTARDLQNQDIQWTRAKSFDTFCPLGPWIETDFTPFDALLTTHVNGQLRQMSSTRDMVFTAHQLVAYISSFLTLEPGDVILTGTPSGIGALKDGDRVKVTVEGIGELHSPVIHSEAHNLQI